MIIYKVIIHIQKEIEQDWLSWMKKEHVPEIMSLNIFMKSKLAEIPIALLPKSLKTKVFLPNHLINYI